LAGHDEFAGVPHAAWPGATVLLLASVVVLTRRRWAVWALAVVLLAGSCWLLNLVELALAGTVTDRHGGPCLAGVPATPRPDGCRRAAGRGRCAAQHWRRPAGRARRPGADPPDRLRRLCRLAAVRRSAPARRVRVPGLEPDSDRPTYSMAAVLCVGLGLAVFLLPGLVRPWGMVFPRWTILLADRPVPRFLPIVPVWLIAPTFVLYGLGAAIYVGLLTGGVLRWHGRTGFGALSYIGVAMPISFAGYGLALTACVVSYQLRTRPTPAARSPKPGADSPKPTGQTALDFGL
jgi:hypothetical protein